ncbi:hypothetical protein [Anabaena sp. CA = ATCC 33047]|uniref:hypothetical protein n=1 Tax=Anabaena sp. (strain CA / ATCC 33047) TaxID=52271 RepID=UPI00082F00D1|nr:hypothetical protein [Anabaena sp. CA = ATCC 33047]
MEDSASSSDSVPRPKPENCTHPTAVTYSITVALPGQVTFCVPRISEDSNYLQRLLKLLKQETGIITQEVNAETGSVVISYKLGLKSDLAMRSHLANLLQAADYAEVKPEIADFPPQPSLHPLTIEPPTTVACNIVHAIPGRVRFHVPQIASDPAYVERLEAVLQADPVVKSERVNRDAASVIITYQPQMFRNSHQQMPRVYTAAVPYLTHLIQLAGITAEADIN